MGNDNVNINVDFFPAGLRPPDPLFIYLLDGWMDGWMDAHPPNHG